MSFILAECRFCPTANMASGDVLEIRGDTYRVLRGDVVVAEGRIVNIPPSTLNSPSPTAVS